MREAVLARMWQLPDGTACLLLKDPRAAEWELRIARGEEILRAEHFTSPIVAMEQAKVWRAACDRGREGELIRRRADRGPATESGPA
jgi:hypothetical protein